jgi:hypothetical protein
MLLGAVRYAQVTFKATCSRAIFHLAFSVQERDSKALEISENVPVECLKKALKLTFFNFNPNRACENLYL